MRNRPDLYTEAVLGKPPKEYSAWILDPTQWGGEIELFILSQYYGAEIVAIEIKSQHSYVYGEGKSYTRRIYVLYDGVHYDAIAGAAGTASAPESMDVRQFPAGDEESKAKALALAAQLKQVSGGEGPVGLTSSKLQMRMCVNTFADGLGPSLHVHFAFCQQSRQFVDLGGFSLRCLICHKGLTGEKEAMAHAQVTKHQNFAQF